MPAVNVNGIRLEYEACGNKSDPAMVLIMGLGNQLTAWPEKFYEMLSNRGFYVIRFDNRDVGLSTKIKVKKEPNILLLILLSKLGIRPNVPYTLNDMALDTVGLLDQLKIESAHIIGISMGGMIAQLVAAGHRQRVKTITCIISSSGNPSLPGPGMAVIKKMLQRPKNRDKEAWLQYYCELFTMIGSPLMNREALRQKIRENIDRSFYPKESVHQFAAIINSGSRVKLLQQIESPTLVISGALDPLVPYAAGEDIAANIKNSRFELIENLGHDLPDPLIPQIVDLIATHATQPSRGTVPLFGPLLSISPRQDADIPGKIKCINRDPAKHPVRPDKLQPDDLYR